MKLKLWKPIVAILLILFAAAYLWNGFLLYIAGFGRVHTAVEITDENRAGIIAMIQENAQEYGEVPNMQDAVKMEYLVLRHHCAVTVFYEDGNSYRFFLEEYSAPLPSYLKNEGYNVYFRSKDFLIDLAKTMVFLALTAISAVLLINKRPKVS